MKLPEIGYGEGKVEGGNFVWIISGQDGVGLRPPRGLILFAVEQLSE